MLLLEYSLIKTFHTNKLIFIISHLKFAAGRKGHHTEQWRIQDFPLGGRRPVGGANLRCLHFSAKTYAKMKEIDPVGGGGAPVAPPRSANAEGPFLLT